jgi:hypothetical protein
MLVLHSSQRFANVFLKWISKQKIEISFREQYRIKKVNQLLISTKNKKQLISMIPLRKYLSEHLLPI